MTWDVPLANPDMRIYYNGQLLKEGVGLSQSSGTLTQFAKRGTDNKYYYGQIDDFRVYNYTLTPEQIRNDYNQGAVHFGP